MIQGQTLFSEWWESHAKHFPQMRYLCEQAYLLGLSHGAKEGAKEDWTTKEKILVDHFRDRCLAFCDTHNSGHFGNKESEIEQRHERNIAKQIRAAFDSFKPAILAILDTRDKDIIELKIKGERLASDKWDLTGKIAKIKKQIREFAEFMVEEHVFWFPDTQFDDVECQKCNSSIAKKRQDIVHEPECIIGKAQQVLTKDGE